MDERMNVDGLMDGRRNEWVEVIMNEWRRDG